MKTIKGNLLNETMGLIVHGCNAQGVMNSGIAAPIRNTYPSVYHDYIYRYHRNGNKLELGDVIFTKINHGLVIASAITQEFYGKDANTVYVDYEAIERCFEKINTFALRYHYVVKYPKIGCGLANGDWDVVKDIIDKTMSGKVSHFLYTI